MNENIIQIDSIKKYKEQLLMKIKLAKLSWKKLKTILTEIFKEINTCK